MDLTEKLLTREEVFQGKILHVVNDTVKLPNGKTATREVVLHNGAVCILPLTGNGEVIVERQFRYAGGREMLEIPAGKLEKGEDPLECAKRELEEETGLCAKKWTNIGRYIGSPAILSEKITMFLAEDLYEGKTNFDDDEFLEVTGIPLDTLVQMVMNNEIEDGKTQLCVLKVKALLSQRSE